MIRRYCAEWGWIKCRDIVVQAAVRAFLAGNDSDAALLRDLVNTSLVIGERSLENAPVEHCAKGCGCR